MSIQGIGKQAEKFEALAVGLRLDTIPKPDGTMQDEQERKEEWETVNPKSLVIDASISAIHHAIKMATKATQDLAKGREQQAKMAVSIALETLQDVLERLQ